MKIAKTIQLIILAMFVTICSVNAQSNKKKSATVSTTAQYVYYVDTKGVDTKNSCLAVENNISKKTNVISFRTVGFPSKYFVLKSSKAIKESELKLWLSENNVELTFFGNSEKSLEELIFNKRKNNKK
jgi:hypothetical protein